MGNLLNHRFFVVCCAAAAFLCPKPGGAGAPCDPVFSALPIFDVGNNVGTSAVADLDGDGWLDLTTGMRYFLGNGEGGFLGPYDLVGGGSLIRTDVAVRDFDGDGLPDLAAAAYSSREILVFFGTVAPGTPSELFAAPIILPTFGAPWHIACTDVNGDSWIDVVITTEDSSDGRVFLNDGNCCGPLFAEAGDANADGAIDLGDPIAILGHLFGAHPLRCEPAGELNDDGRIDLADPIYLLSYLFTHEPPPLGGPVDCCGGM